MDSECVDAAFELTDKCCVDHAVAFEPALPAEHLRHNIHPEMSLPALPMPGMPRVLVGFVHHVEPYGGESLGQLLRDEIAPCHGVRIAGARPVGQCRPRREMTSPIFISAPCACAASGQAAAPPSSVMKARRLIRSPHRRWRATADEIPGRAPWQS